MEEPTPCPECGTAPTPGWSSKPASAPLPLDPNGCVAVANCAGPDGELVPLEVTVTGFEFTGDVNVSPDGPVSAAICVDGVDGVLFGQCNDGVGSWKAHDIGAGVTMGMPPAGWKFGSCSFTAVPLEPVCALVDGAAAEITPVVTLGGAAPGKLYFDKYGDPVDAALVSPAGPNDCDCGCVPLGGFDISGADTDFTNWALNGSTTALGTLAPAGWAIADVVAALNANDPFGGTWGADGQTAVLVDGDPSNYVSLDFFTEPFSVPFQPA